MTDRDDFEAVFSKPPFEFSMERYDDDGTWPGNYRKYHVQCVWEGWQEKARAKPVVPDGYVLLPIQDALEYLDILTEEANWHLKYQAEYRPERQAEMDESVKRVRSLLTELPKEAV
jgi:hypothetical protein